MLSQGGFRSEDMSPSIFLEEILWGEEMSKKVRNLDLTPDTSLLAKIGVGNFTVAEAIAELIANSFDARVYSTVEDQDFAAPIEIDVKVAGDSISIIDNGKGMTPEVLEAALTLAKDMDEITGNTRSRMGLFGLGMKSASSSLGKAWTVTTKTAEAAMPVSVAFDLDTFASEKNWSGELVELDDKSDNPLAEYEHGTCIHITKLHHDSPSEGPILELLGTSYKPLISAENVIRVNGQAVMAKPYNLLDGSKIVIDIVIDEEKDWRVTGWGGLDTKTHNDGYYGFQLYRKDQLIEPWNKDFFRAHLMTSRILGELHLNFIPTNYTKKGFHQDSKEWKAARTALIEILKPLAKASGDMAKGKNDPMRGAKAIQGLQKAAGIAPRIDAGDFPEPSEKPVVAAAPVITVEPESIVIGNEVINLVFAFEDFGDEPILWDYIYDGQELQAVINTGSKLYESVSDSKFLGILALADVVIRFLISERGMTLDRALDIRDKWILASVG
jgi:hypothetical protein